MSPSPISSRCSQSGHLKCKSSCQMPPLKSSSVFSLPPGSFRNSLLGLARPFETWSPRPLPGHLFNLVSSLVKIFSVPQLHCELSLAQDLWTRNFLFPCLSAKLISTHPSGLILGATASGKIFPVPLRKTESSSLPCIQFPSIPVMCPSLWPHS